MFLDYFDVLILKIKKNTFFLMYFQAKIILKNNLYHITRQALRAIIIIFSKTKGDSSKKKCCV